MAHRPVIIDDLIRRVTALEAEVKRCEALIDSQASARALKAFLRLHTEGRVSKDELFAVLITDYATPPASIQELRIKHGLSNEGRSTNRDEINSCCRVDSDSTPPASEEG